MGTVVRTNTWEHVSQQQGSVSEAPSCTPCRHLPLQGPTTGYVATPTSVEMQPPSPPLRHSNTSQTRGMGTEHAPTPRRYLHWSHSLRDNRRRLQPPLNEHTFQHALSNKTPRHREQLSLDRKNSRPHRHPPSKTQGLYVPSNQPLWSHPKEIKPGKMEADHRPFGTRRPQRQRWH